MKSSPFDCYQSWTKENAWEIKKEERREKLIKKIIKKIIKENAIEKGKVTWQQ